MPPLRLNLLFEQAFLSSFLFIFCSLFVMFSLFFLVYNYFGFLSLLQTSFLFIYFTVTSEEKINFSSQTLLYLCLILFCFFCAFNFEFVIFSFFCCLVLFSLLFLTRSYFFYLEYLLILHFFFFIKKLNLNVI